MVDRVLFAGFVLAMVVFVAAAYHMHVTCPCLEYQVSTDQYVEQPLYVGTQHFKVPLGGGTIKTREIKTCIKRKC